MQVLKRTLRLGALLFAAYLTLDLLRVGWAPAQGREGAGAQVATRNGDVDCDGQVNINDPLVLLRWLFQEGPEPCAIAQQPDTCCESLREEVASLRAAVETLAARVPSPRDIVLFEGVANFPAQGGAKTIYTVPSDKWFVLTSAKYNGDLLEVLDGKSAKVPAILRAEGNAKQWTTGYAFPPGSEIVYSYPRAYYDPPAPFSFDYSVNGYLAGE